MVSGNNLQEHVALVFSENTGLSNLCRNKAGVAFPQASGQSTPVSMLKRRMHNDDDKYVWWIDELRPDKTSGVNANRFLLYGPYVDKQTAAGKIADLKKLPRYANSDLVVSKQFGPEVMQTSR